MLLVLVGAVADLSEAMDEHRPCQAVASLALVQLLSRFPAELRLADPVEREKRALEPSQLAQRGGNSVLSRIRRELAHDHRGRHRAGADRGNDPQDLGPVRPDQGDVDAASDHLLQCGIVGRLLETVEPAMLEVRNARRELEAE